MSSPTVSPTINGVATSVPVTNASATVKLLAVGLPVTVKVLLFEVDPVIVTRSPANKAEKSISAAEVIKSSATGSPTIVNAAESVPVTNSSATVKLVTEGVPVTV